MPLTTFNPPVQASPGTNISYKPRLLVAEFGDGYSQIAPDGINHIVKSVSLSWKGLTQDQADLIIAFFEARGGYEPFWYKPSNGVLSKWTCREWSDENSGIRKITATFERSNTLEI